MVSDRKLIYGLLIFFIISILLILGIRRSSDRRDCSYTVTLTNGEVLKGNKINWYPSGFSDIQLCGGERIPLPASSIKEIKKWNKIIQKPIN